MDYAALKAELAAGHPVTGSYDADDAIAAGQLNAENCLSDVETVTGQQVFEAVVPAHYTTLSAEYKQLFGVIVGMGMIMVNGPNTKLALATMFAGATETLAALVALQTELISRAAELEFGRVRTGHVQQARSE